MFRQRAQQRGALERGAADPTAAQLPLVAAQLEAEPDGGVTHHDLARRCVEPELGEADHRELRVHMHPSARGGRPAARGARVDRVDRHAAHAGRRRDGVVERRSTEVIDVHLEVARLPLRAATR
eukprot:scaffold54148_cov36-Phaeocystis_antarctica.AAC.1